MSSISDVLGFSSDNITTHPQQPCIAYSCGYIFTLLKIISSLLETCHCARFDESASSVRVRGGKKGGSDVGGLSHQLALICIPSHRPAIVIWNWEHDTKSVFGTESGTITSLSFHPDGGINTNRNSCFKSINPTLFRSLSCCRM